MASKVNPKSPGVYIVEKKGPERLPAIVGVEASTLAVAGATTKGDDTKAIVVKSLAEYRRTFGGPTSKSNIYQVVKGYFDNGGNRCAVVRHSGGVKNTWLLKDDDDTTIFTFTAKSKGVWGNHIVIKLKDNVDADATNHTVLDVEVYYDAYGDEHFESTVQTDRLSLVETFERCLIDDTDTSDPNYILNVITDTASDYITVAYTAADGGTFVDYSIQAGLTSADTGAEGTATNTGDWQGLYATDGTSKFDGVLENMLFVAPDFDGDAEIEKLMTYADYRGTGFVICAGESTDLTVANATAFRRGLTATNTRTAMYWPWVKVYDELTQSVKTMTPVGHVAGCYARTDAIENIGKAPAGITDGQLYGITDIDKHLLLPDRDTLYQDKVNPLVADSTLGMVVWGARTTSLEFQWRYVNARRLFMYVEESVRNATQWVVFENNGSALWNKVKMQVGGFLSNLYADGYFAGNTPEEAYFVVCDSSNNPSSSVDNGFLYVDIGLAVNKPAEFVVFRFSQKTL